MSRGYGAVYLMFCALIAVGVWMFAYSLILVLVWKDARILYLMTTADPLAPFEQLAAYIGNRSLQLVAASAAIPALCAGVTAAAFGLRRPSNPLGDAAFQDVAALRRSGWFRKDGHVFGAFGGRILRRRDDRHHLIIGPTRSGKGVSYVIPNALMFPGSMIVTDLKGEIFDRTAAYRKAQGHQVFVFSPGSAKTHRWNPLDFVRTDRGSRTIDIQNMAAILIPESVGSENAVWQGTAQQVIAGVISYILESRCYRNRRNLGEVNAFFNAGVDLQLQMKLIKDNETDLSRFTTDSFNAYISLNERAARSALLDIQKALAPFRNERVIAATDVTDMAIAALQRRPVTIYLTPSITDMTILRSLLTLFVQQVMDLLTREHNPGALPVYFLLDEFRQLKRMDEILNKLPYVAGFNIKLAFIIQDLKNIDGIYGETARHSLLGNCGLQLILGANDQATADYASRALGKRTIRYQSVSRTLELLGLPRRTMVEQIRERDLMMPQEIRQMSGETMILLVEGQRPIKARKIAYYKVEPFRSAVANTTARVEIPEVELRPMPMVPIGPQDDGHSSIADPEKPQAPEQMEEIKSTKPQAPEQMEEIKSTKPQAPEEMKDTKSAKPEAPAPMKGTKSAPKVPKKTSVTKRNRVKSDRTGAVTDRAPAQVRLVKTAQRLSAAVEKIVHSAPDLSPGQRKSIDDIMASTVPDPVEIGTQGSPDDF